MSQKRYLQYSTQEYYGDNTPRNYRYVPSQVIMPQGYGVSDFTPRTIQISPPSYSQMIVPQQVGSAIMGIPVLVQQPPIARWIVNAYTGRLELVYY